MRYYYTVTAVAADSLLGDIESLAISWKSTITQGDASPSSVVLSVADAHRIDVFWSDNSGNETSYQVYHRGGIFFDWTLAATLPADSTFFTDKGLDEDTEYEYQVFALHSQSSPPPATSQPTTTGFATLYRGLIQVFLGFTERRDSNAGMARLARDLRAIRVFTAGGELRYRVPLYESDNPQEIDPQGNGTAKDELLDHVIDGDVRDVAMVGYSWGAGGVWSLAERARIIGLTGAGGLARLKYTAYVDGIRLQNNVGRPEFRIPPNTQFHANYYQTFLGPVPTLRGQSIPASNINHRVTNAEHGGVVHHTNIDDSAFVRGAVINTILNRMPLQNIQ